MDQEKKKNNKKGNKSGYIEIFCGVVLLLTGIWLFRQTWGIRLLTVDVWIGRISRYYGIFLISAGIFYVIGFWTIAHMERTIERTADLEIAKDIKEPPAQTKNQITCPVCGRENILGNKFCVFCGGGLEGIEKNIN